MDHISVDSPVAGLRATPVARDFAADFPIVVNYVARLMDDIDSAAGIACEAYRQVIELSAGSQPASRVEVFRVATELSHRALRPRRWFRRQRHPALTLQDFPEPDARRALRRDTVQRALAALPFEQRATVLLRDYVKLSYEELADVLGVPVRKMVHALDRSRAELVEVYDYIKF